MIDDTVDGENENENEFYDIYPVATCQTTSISTAIGVMLDKMAFESFGCATSVDTIKIIGPNPIEFGIEDVTAYEVAILSNNEPDTCTMVGRFVIVRTGTEIIPEDEIISKIPT